LDKSLEQNEVEVSTFGERLRGERELRAISLDEISATTKIGTRLLRALEEEQFDLLPGGIFNKGYVRAYAKYLGIDEEKAIADYLQAAHDAAPGHTVPDPTLSIRFEQSSREVVNESPRSALPGVPILIALILLAAAAGGWRLYRERRLDRQQQVAIAVAHDTTQTNSTLNRQATSIPTPEKSSSPSPVTASTVPATETHAANSAAHGPFEVTIRPTGRAWVSIKSDGKFVINGIIKPPDVKTIRAGSRVIFWTGNAGAVEVSFNGKNVPLPGGKNDERVLVFNSGGLLPPSVSQ
jgi:cytoskeleton protein RodZ